MQPDAMRAEVRPTALANGESKHDERAHGQRFRPSGEIVQQRTPAYADYVDEGQDGNQRQGENVGPSQTDSQRRKDDVLLAHARKDSARVCRRRYRQGSDAPAVGYGKQHPAKKESDEAPKGLAQKNVLPPRLGKHAPQFAKRDAATQPNNAPSH